MKATAISRAQMPATSEGMVTVEKTPAYLTAKTAPARVAAMDPKTKLLVVLRDPVTRALSGPY